MNYVCSCAYLKYYRRQADLDKNSNFGGIIMKSCFRDYINPVEDRMHNMLLKKGKYFLPERLVNRQPSPETVREAFIRVSQNVVRRQRTA